MSGVNIVRVSASVPGCPIDGDRSGVNARQIGAPEPRSGRQSLTAQESAQKISDVIDFLNGLPPRTRDENYYNLMEELNEILESASTGFFSKDDKKLHIFTDAAHDYIDDAARNTDIDELKTAYEKAKELLPPGKDAPSSEGDEEFLAALMVEMSDPDYEDPEFLRDGAPASRDPESLTVISGHESNDGNDRDHIPPSPPSLSRLTALLEEDRKLSQGDFPARVPPRGKKQVALGTSPITPAALQSTLNKLRVGKSNEFNIVSLFLMRENNSYLLNNLSEHDINDIIKYCSDKKSGVDITSASAITQAIESWRSNNNKNNYYSSDLSIMLEQVMKDISDVFDDLSEEDPLFSLLNEHTFRQRLKSAIAERALGRTPEPDHDSAGGLAPSSKISDLVHSLGPIVDNIRSREDFRDTLEKVLQALSTQLPLASSAQSSDTLSLATQTTDTAAPLDSISQADSPSASSAVAAASVDKTGQRDLTIINIKDALNKYASDKSNEIVKSSLTVKLALDAFKEIINELTIEDDDEPDTVADRASSAIESVRDRIKDDYFGKDSTINKFLLMKLDDIERAIYNDKNLQDLEISEVNDNISEITSSISGHIAKILSDTGEMSRTVGKLENGALNTRWIQEVSGEQKFAPEALGKSLDKWLGIGTLEEADQADAASAAKGAGGAEATEASGGGGAFLSWDDPAFKLFRELNDPPESWWQKLANIVKRMTTFKRASKWDAIKDKWNTDPSLDLGVFNSFKSSIGSIAKAQGMADINAYINSARAEAQGTNGQLPSPEQLQNILMRHHRAAHPAG